LTDSINLISILCNGGCYVLLDIPGAGQIDTEQMRTNSDRRVSMNVNGKGGILSARVYEKKQLNVGCVCVRAWSCYPRAFIIFPTGHDIRGSV